MIGRLQLVLGILILTDWLDSYVSATQVAKGAFDNGSRAAENKNVELVILFEAA